MLTKIILVFLGSGFGGVLRFALTRIIEQRWDSALPLGTLVINISGCFAAGLLAECLTGSSLLREDCRIALVVGVLGGYTTFSAFGHQTMSLLFEGRWPTAALYIALSNVLSLMGAWAGASLGDRVRIWLV